MNRKLLLAAHLVFCLLLIQFSFSADTENLSSFSVIHGTGFRKPNETEKKYIGNKIQRVTQVLPNKTALARFRSAPSTNYGLPATVKNWQYLPSVGDQGTQSSCSAWSSCYYLKTYQEAKEHSWVNPNPNLNPEHIMSPAFGYNLANYGFDTGSSPELIMQLICDHGCASLKDMPWTASDYIGWPTESAWKNALSYRANASSKIDLSTDAGITALKQVIANGDVAVIGVEVYDNFGTYPLGTGINNNVLYANSGSDRGGHAITVIGYDDNKTYNDGAPKTGAFQIINSWGTSWGIVDEPADIGTKGFMWMAYTYVRDLSTYKEAYIMTDMSNYSPTVLGRFTISHSARGDLNVYFLGGDNYNNPDWNFNCLPNLGGDHTLGQKIVVDLSLFNLNYNKRFWLKVGDSNPSIATGQITYMSVEKIGKGEATSLDVPKNTVNNSNVYVGMIYDLTNPSLNQILTYPNPFNIRKGGILRFSRIPLEAENTIIYIYNVAGDLIRTLKEGTDIETLSDTKIAKWDGKNDYGNEVATGIYVWLAKCEGKKSTGKIALVR